MLSSGADGAVLSEFPTTYEIFLRVRGGPAARLAPMVKPAKPDPLTSLGGQFSSCFGWGAAGGTQSSGSPRSHGLGSSKIH